MITHRGSCLCGAIHYELSAELGDFGYCHCKSCRKASGSAHAANAPIPTSAFHVDDPAGALREFESSPGKLRAFCTRCGSPIYARIVARPDVLRIRLGSLDTSFAKTAKAHTFVADKAEWDVIAGPLPQFPGWAAREVLDQPGTLRTD